MITGVLGTGDSPAFTQHFDSRNVGPRTVIVGGVINDGNAGANYSYSFNTAPGAINQRAIIVTAASVTRAYDGTTGSTGVPVITGGLGTGDTPNFSQVFDSPDVGIRTLTASGDVNDGNGGGNYSYTFQTTLGAINPLGITVTADSGQTKVYGTFDPTLTYLVTGGTLRPATTSVGLRAGWPARTWGNTASSRAR